MPEPGTEAWTGFLKKLKEASPEDYRSALLLGGGITQALQKEISRSKRRDQFKEFFARLFLRDHPTGKVPDKRKIGLLLFLLVGGLFAFAFFFGTAPKKKAQGGGVGTQAVSGLLGKEGASSGIPTVDVSGRAKDLNAHSPEGQGDFGPGHGQSQAGQERTTYPAGSGVAPSSVQGQGQVESSTSPSPQGGQTGGLPNLPPPPPPVYGSYASAGMPPEPSLAQAQTALPGPPPMVLYMSTGMPSQASPSSAPSPAPTGTDTSLERGMEASPSPMLVQQVPSGGILVYTGSPPSGMAVGQGDTVSPAPSPTPYPVNPPGEPFMPSGSPSGVGALERR